jgi:uncharacterized protein (DUF58 family)
LYIAMTLLLGFAAVNTGNNLIYLLVSALLGFMAVSGVLGRGNFAGLRVSIEPPEEVYDGRQTLVRVRVENRRRFLPAFLIRVVLLDTEVTFSVVDPAGSATAAATVTFRGRGLQCPPPAQVFSIFPINFFVRRWAVPMAGPVTVFPAPVACGDPFGPEGDAGGGERLLPERGSEGEISRIADYRGEPMKRIHWKLSARQGELKVKELSTVAREPVLLDPEALSGTTLKARLRSASFLIIRYLREGRPVGLILGGRKIPPETGRAHKLRLLTELALYGRD